MIATNARLIQTAASTPVQLDKQYLHVTRESDIINIAYRGEIRGHLDLVRLDHHTSGEHFGFLRDQYKQVRKTLGPNVWVAESMSVNKTGMGYGPAILLEALRIVAGDWIVNSTSMSTMARGMWSGVAKHVSEVRKFKIPTNLIPPDQPFREDLEPGQERAVTDFVTFRGVKGG